MLTKELYSKGSRIWVPHPDLVWEGAEVLEDFQSRTLVVRTEDGKVKNISISNDNDLPPLRNPDILIGENDLTSLSYLHEPAVLYNLQVRFCIQQAIYTYCGIVLVAINPYTELSMYDSDRIWAYRGQAMGDLEPHIFAVTEEAFTKMEREQKDQSIIVSGESGAGKTVSAKYAMRYFATVGGSATETHVEKKVLASSPIMEAIGNAKTTRNDNSSRFGKFIELQFSRSNNIIGASMRTYLLEKSRVVFQAPGERNYHIFYQLCAARSCYPHLKLSDPSSYQYLSEQSSITGVNDADAFGETRSAFATLGFSDADLDDVFKILAAVLHLGNISIIEGSGTQGDSDSSYISETDPHLSVLSDLLQINIKELRLWLCHRRIVSMRETFDKPMTIIEAVCSRDALAKHIYAELFSYIVSVINITLEKASEKRHKFIGVLDIYGFETFEINSFEQFCINYANEKLQQQFNQHVFKLEQEEYLKEEIEWKFIDFYDNQPCIDLIEAKLGILDLLDEECRMPKGSDSSWAEKLYDKCSKWQHFVKPRFGTSAFVIKHFADRVEYDVTGFLEKNRDTVMEEQVSVIRNGGNRLVQKLFVDPESGKRLAASATMPRTRVPYSMKSMSATVGATSKHKKSVGSQFRDSLNALMATLNATTPHYIRCIKPNDNKQPFEYNPTRAVQQLRACGVLETIRISAAGFPSRWLYIDFFHRYRVLCHSKYIHRDDLKVTCECVLGEYIKDTDKFKFGRTKIFFRAGQVAYLEKLRSTRLTEQCVLIQKAIRGFVQRRKYAKILAATKCFQRYTRGFLARRCVEAIRRNKAAVVIQKYVRGWLRRTQYRRLTYIVLRLQTRGRGLLARRRFTLMRYNHAATVIGKHVRGWLCRRWYKQQLRHIIVCQNSIRRYFARKALKKLKIEARSVENIKQLNKGLENKIINLQQRIEELLKENAALRNLPQEISDLKQKLDHLRGVENELKKLSFVLSDRESKLSELISELEQERSEKMDILSEKDEIQCEFEKLKKNWINEKSNLETEVSALKEENRNNKINAEELLLMKLEEEKQFFIKEQEEIHIAYQKLVAEKNHFEAKCDNLSQEISRMRQSGHTRSLSDASTISGGTDEIHEEDVDVGILLKLQQKLELLESEKERLHLLLEAKYESFNDHKVLDDFKLQQLEMDNSKLKSDLLSLRTFVADNVIVEKGGGEELIKQFAAIQTELERAREETIQLKSVLASKTQGIKNIATANYATSDVNLSLINEDGELVLAFEAQKKVNRQLEDELKENEKLWSIERRELSAELARLKEDNERQQKLLASNLTKNPQTQNEAFLQHEITRLVNENLRLHNEKDRILEQIRSHNGQYREPTRRDGRVTINDRLSEPPRSSMIVSSTEKLNNPVVRKKETTTSYMGMFEFRKEDDSIIIRHLVQDLKPSIAVNLLPGLPAYILFMCIRHTDFINDDEKVRGLLIGYINVVKKIIRKRSNDLETMVLWLSNTLRLLHNLKQYSGEKAFKGNTVSQNEQCLRNFDLSEYRQVISDTAVWIYQGVIRYTESKVSPKVVPAILEHEEITGSSGGIRPRAPSLTEPNVTLQKSLDSLLQELTSFHRILVCHAVDPEIIIQIFRQLFYFICASSLNKLLLRKDLCVWSKGMQIRYNLSHLEQWTKDHKLQNSDILNTLAPIIQASQLLQARKSDDDVDTVCQMCSNMLPEQIIKLLKMYTPDGYDQRIPVSFIKKVTQRLQQERGIAAQDKPVLMDTKFNFAVRFPFNPSDIRLEDIEIPEVLNLPMLKKI